ncbi:hypothetical protein BC940DRAFT_354411 [Gongronella butleri]|nr:hypothetical protein BC940DRAFT_354411 [Gongronella butleri]
MANVHAMLAQAQPCDNHPWFDDADRQDYFTHPSGVIISTSRRNPVILQEQLGTHNQRPYVTLRKRVNGRARTKQFQVEDLMVWSHHGYRIGYFVEHLDGDLLNCAFDNLRYLNGLYKVYGGMGPWTEAQAMVPVIHPMLPNEAFLMNQYAFVISSHGNVVNPIPQIGNQQLQIKFSLADRQRVMIQLSELVARTFLGWNAQSGLEIYYIDGDNTNCALSNIGLESLVDRNARMCTMISEREDSEAHIARHHRLPPNFLCFATNNGHLWTANGIQSKETPRNQAGRLSTNVGYQNVQFSAFVDEVVMETFGDYQPGARLVHLDSNPANNAFDNLAYWSNADLQAYWIGKLARERNVAYLPLDELRGKPFDSYLIGSDGDTFSLFSERSLQVASNCSGYPIVSLVPSNWRATNPYVCYTFTATVHSLVIHVHHGPRPAGMVVDHINAIKTDNRIQNLRYVTQADNIRLYHAEQRYLPHIQESSLELDAQVLEDDDDIIGDIDLDEEEEITANSLVDVHTLHWQSIGVVEDLDFSAYHASLTGGLIMNASTGLVLAQSVNMGGYAYVLPVDAFTGQRVKMYVHRLICHTYKPELFFDDAACDHIDQNKQNNDASNLRWITPKENAQLALGKRIIIHNYADPDQFVLYLSLADAAIAISWRRERLRRALIKTGGMMSITSNLFEENGTCFVMEANDDELDIFNPEPPTPSSQ